MSDDEDKEDDEVPPEGPTDSLASKPDLDSMHVPTIKDKAADEIQDQAIVADARDDGQISGPVDTSDDDMKPVDPDSGEREGLEDDESEMEMEEIIPAPRTIKLRFNGSSSTTTTAPPDASSKRPRRGIKRKDLTPDSEEGDVELASPPVSSSKSRSKRSARTPKVKIKAERSTPIPSTRSLRSRAPKSEEKVQADRDARARIRAALSEDVGDGDEEDEDEADLEL